MQDATTRLLRVLAQEKRQWSKDAPDNSPVLAIADGLPNDDTNHVEPSSNGDPSENNNQEPNNDDAEVRMIRQPTMQRKVPALHLPPRIVPLRNEGLL